MRRIPWMHRFSVDGDVNMAKRFLILTLTAILSVCIAHAATITVDMAGLTNLDVVVDSHHSGTGDIDATSVASGDTLILENQGAGNSTVTGAKFSVEGGGTLLIKGVDTKGGMIITLNSTGVYGDFTVGSTGSSAAGTVVLGDPANDVAMRINGRKLNIVNGDFSYAAQSNNIILNFSEFAFAKGTFTMAGAAPNLNITGSAVIGDGESANSNAIFYASGIELARFSSGLEITRGGTFTKNDNGSDASIYLGASGGALRLTGGEISNSTADKLIFLAKNVYVDGDEKSTITGTGVIQFNDNDSTLTVRQDLDVLNASIRFQNYTQTAGAVLVDGSGGLLTVTESATIRGSASSFAGAADFLGGATFSNGATLGGMAGMDTTIATAADTAVIIDAKAFIDITKSSVILKDSNTTVTIAGAIRIGDAGNTLDVTAGGRVTFESGAVFRISDDARSSVTEGQVVVAAAGLSTVRGFDKTNHIDDHFLLGEFHLAQAQVTGSGYTAGDIYISKAVAGAALDGTDFAEVRDRVVEKYGPIVNTPGFIENIYKSVSNTTSGSLALLQPAAGVVMGSGSDLEKSYLMNLANFQGFAGYDAAVRDGSLAAMYTGYNNSGVAEIAIDTSNALISRVHDHVRLNNAIRARLRENVCGGDDAVAAALNSQFENHFWFGGFGLFDDVDADSRLAGYRYESYGFITGYDYAAGPLTVGGVFAYARGDYYDKTALRHDSTISSYSVALHGTYNHESGLYVTGTGGFTYSDNDINELRGDVSVTSGTSWNQADYHGNTFNLGMELGYDIVASNGLAVTPSIGIRHIRTKSASHDERLGNVLAGRITGVEKNATYLPVRVDLGYTVSTGSESSLRLTFGGGYSYSFNTDGIKGAFNTVGFSNAYSHAVLGRESDRHYYEVGAGIRFTTDRINLGLNYDYAASSNTRIHRVMGTAGFSF